MKQKRLVSQIVALIVMVSAVLVITGCNQATGNKGNTNGGGTGGNTGGSGTDKDKIIITVEVDEGYTFKTTTHSVEAKKGELWGMIKTKAEGLVTIKADYDANGWKLKNSTALNDSFEFTKNETIIAVSKSKTPSEDNDTTTIAGVTITTKKDANGKVTKITATGTMLLDQLSTLISKSKDNIPIETEGLKITTFDEDYENIPVDVDVLKKTAGKVTVLNFENRNGGKPSVVFDETANVIKLSGSISLQDVTDATAIQENKDLTEEEKKDCSKESMSKYIVYNMLSNPDVNTESSDLMVNAFERVYKELDAKYIAAYSGAFGGDLVGTWTGNVKRYGTFKGVFTVTATSDIYVAKGTVKSTGELSGSATKDGVTIEFSGNITDDGTITNGKWNVKDSTKKGSVTGKKN